MRETKTGPPTLITEAMRDELTVIAQYSTIEASPHERLSRTYLFLDPIVYLLTVSGFAATGVDGGRTYLCHLSGVGLLPLSCCQQLRPLLGMSRTEGVVKSCVTDLIWLLFALTLRGPSGGHCVEL